MMQFPMSPFNLSNEEALGCMLLTICCAGSERVTAECFGSQFVTRANLIITCAHS